MRLRVYQEEDLDEVIRLFYTCVHTVNAEDYTREQLDAWAPEDIRREEWNKSLSEHYTLLAEAEGRLAGFGDIRSDGYLDRLFVHPDFLRRGVGTLLCERLESTVQGKITAEVSLTALPFFLARGYTAVKEQEVIRKGVRLKNYAMNKYRQS